MVSPMSASIFSGVSSITSAHIEVFLSLLDGAFSWYNFFCFACRNKSCRVSPQSSLTLVPTHRHHDISGNKLDRQQNCTLWKLNCQTNASFSIFHEHYFEVATNHCWHVQHSQDHVHFERIVWSSLAWLASFCHISDALPALRSPQWCLHMLYPHHLVSRVLFQYQVTSWLKTLTSWLKMLLKQ